jgi:hypothetical protein
MLRKDVVDACAAGRFHVYAVATIHEALTVLTGVEAGEADEDGTYPDDTLLAHAVDRAREFWLRAVYRPEVELVSDDDEEVVEDAGDTDDEDS